MDWKKLYGITKAHDYGEIFIGDIKTPVKHYSLELRGMLEKEEGMISHFISENIPEEFKSIFRRQLREGKDDSVEGLILEVADKLDQVYEAFTELRRGNTEKEFVVMYREALIKIKNINLHCVDYFFAGYIA